MTQEPSLLDESEKNKPLKKVNLFKKIKIILMVFALLLSAHFAFQIVPAILSPIEGKAKSAQELDIQLMTEGVLKKAYVRNAQEVKTNDILFEFENPDLELEIVNLLQKKEIEENELKLMEKESALAGQRVESARVLYENGVISKLDLDNEEFKANTAKDKLNAKAKTVEQSTLHLNLLQLRKESLLIKAPFDGIFLGELEPRIGSYFKQGEKLGILFNPKEFYFEAFITEEKLNHVKVGDRARVTFNSVRGNFYGEISEKDAKVEETIVKIYRTKYVSRILVRLTNPPMGLVPGLRGFVQIKSDFGLKIPNVEVRN